MMHEVTTTFLEMRSPTQLQTARTPPSPIDFVEIPTSEESRDRLRNIHIDAGSAYGWRQDWIDVNWHVWETLPHHFYVIRIDDEDGGLFILNLNDDMNIEIRMFALTPKFVGRGFGGAALTQGVRLAWTALHDGQTTQRIWLHTASVDHEHALKNYVARGFVVYDVIQEQKELTIPPPLTET